MHYRCRVVTAFLTELPVLRCMQVYSRELAALFTTTKAQLTPTSSLLYLHLIGFLIEVSPHLNFSHSSVYSTIMDWAPGPWCMELLTCLQSHTSFCYMYAGPSHMVGY